MVGRGGIGGPLPGAQKLTSLLESVRVLSENYKTPILKANVWEQDHGLHMCT